MDISRRKFRKIKVVLNKSQITVTCRNQLYFVYLFAITLLFFAYSLNSDNIFAVTIQPNQTFYLFHLIYL